MEANAPYPLERRGDLLLWTIAFGGSLFAGLLIFLIAAGAMAILPAYQIHQDHQPQAAKPPTADSTVLISPDMIQKAEAGKTADAAPPAVPLTTSPEFARTSEDQRGKRPDKPAFIGERDTEATSDRTPDPTAPALPSQSGIEPRPGEFETTESKYRDGPLKDPGATTASGMKPSQESPPAPAVPTAPEPPAAAPEAPPPSPANKEIAEKAAKEILPAAELLQGPNPVDINVPKPAPEKSLPPAKPAPPAEKSTKVAPKESPPVPAKPATRYDDPAFRGNQHKTAINGSIIRNGHSALDVVDSPLGRYQAVIGRAVEQEWQRNCVKHRDFITPGFLTVRFFVEPNGKVKSVQFVGEMQTGEIQKGFTLNSIRDADIPPMPKEMRGDFADRPLELIFNFYF